MEKSKDVGPVEKRGWVSKKRETRPSVRETKKRNRRPMKRSNGVFVRSSNQGQKQGKTKLELEREKKWRKVLLRVNDIRNRSREKKIGQEPAGYGGWERDSLPLDAS